MKKLQVACLLVSSVALLTACQNQNSSTKKESSSKTTEVSESSSSSVSSFNETKSFSSIENNESLTGKLGLSASLLDDYKTPDGIKKYVGTYTGVNNDEEASKGIKIELKINEDGTYRQVTTTYDYPSDLGIQVHGYFDSQGIFHNDKEVNTTIKDKTYASLEGISYSEGILVENYGDIYFKELMSVDSSLSMFLDEQGQMDLVKSVFRDSLRSWSRNSEWVIPTTESDIERFYQSTGLVYSNTDPDIQQLFDLEDKIETDAPRLSGVTLEKSSQVSELITKPLEEILNQEWFESWTKTTNGLYQLVTGSMLGAPSVDPEEQYLQLDGNVDVYTQEGAKVSTAIGYVVKTKSFNVETAYITFNNKVYENVSQKDGKYILD